MIKKTSDKLLANFALTMMKILLVLGFLGFVMMNEEARKKSEEGIKPAAAAMITMSWPDNLDIDIDILIKCPTGEVISFRNKNACLITLERDDVGSVSDIVITDNGKTIRNPINQEIVTFRGLLEGEYVINIHFYGPLSPQIEEIPVKLELKQINPEIKTLYFKEVTLKKLGEEMHIVRFNIDSYNRFTTFVSDLPIKFYTGSFMQTPGAR